MCNRCTYFFNVNSTDFFFSAGATVLLERVKKYIHKIFPYIQLCVSPSLAKRLFLARFSVAVRRSRVISRTCHGCPKETTDLCPISDREALRLVDIPAWLRCAVVCVTRRRVCAVVIVTSDCCLSCLCLLLLLRVGLLLSHHAAET